jgi:hypothetical protein
MRMTPEVRVINETTADMQLQAACPVCEGNLELRVSTDGAWAFCATCHTLVHPRMHRDPHKGVSLEFRARVRA